MSSYGVFKGLHQGFGIYWSGSYNVDGDGEYRTVQAAKDAIDNHIAAQQLLEPQVDATKHLVACRTGDSVTVQTPDGPLSCTIHEFRRNLWDLEAKYGFSVHWV